MMRVVESHDPSHFARRVTPLLLEREALNSVIFGILSRLTARPTGGDTHDLPPLLCAVESSSGPPAAVAVMTPPRPLLLSQAADGAGGGAVEALVDHLTRRGVSLPAVVGPADVAERFAAAWTAGTGVAARLGVDLGVYQLDAVTPPRPVGGSMRPASPDDVDLAAAWAHAFDVEAALPPSGETGRQRAERFIGAGQLFLWCDPGPVAMACKSFPSPNGIRVNFVYTPPENRRRGYASNMVATLSRRLLDEGHRFCFLNTDMANPTSNKIYQQIGYRYVGGQRRYDFRAADASGATGATA